MQKLENGIEVPTNSDSYNLTPDLAKMGETTNAVIPVANVAARDLLTKKPGLAVTRLDITGTPIEIWDGASWGRMGARVIPSAAASVGTPLPATAFTGGGFVPVIQAGSFVTTTDSSGYFAVTFPEAFPNGVLGVIFTNGDTAAGGRDVIIGVAGSPFTASKSTAYGGAVSGTGTAKGNATFRINYIAFGW